MSARAACKAALRSSWGSLWLRASADLETCEHPPLVEVLISLADRCVALRACGKVKKEGWI